MEKNRISLSIDGKSLKYIKKATAVIGFLFITFGILAMISLIITSISNLNRTGYINLFISEVKFIAMVFTGTVIKKISKEIAVLDISEIINVHIPKLLISLIILGIADTVLYTNAFILINYERIMNIIKSIF